MISNNFFSNVLPIQTYAWKIAQTSSALFIYMRTDKVQYIILYYYLYKYSVEAVSAVNVDGIRDKFIIRFRINNVYNNVITDKENILNNK